MPFILYTTEPRNLSSFAHSIVKFYLSMNEWVVWQTDCDNMVGTQWYLFIFGRCLFIYEFINEILLCDRHWTSQRLATRSSGKTPQTEVRLRCPEHLFSWIPLLVVCVVTGHRLCWKLTRKNNFAKCCQSSSHELTFPKVHWPLNCFEQIP